MINIDGTEYSTLEEAIAAIPGEEGWWKSGSEEHYYKAAEELIEKGFSEAEAVEFLSGLYFSAADCFGG